ncbi:protein obstructor-E-like [Argonauta hians]
MVILVSQSKYNCLAQDNGFRCPSAGFSWQADTKNCSISHLCVFGRLVQTITCPKKGLVIGQDNYSCVPKGSHFDNCGDRIKLFVVNDPRCKRNPNGNNPDDNNCANFINCFNSTSMGFQKCPEGLFFSTKNFTCDYPENVFCGSRPISSEYRNLLEIGERCRKEGTHLISNPNNCRRYYECQGGLNSPKTCSPDLVFSPKDQACKQPWEAPEIHC